MEMYDDAEIVKAYYREFGDSAHAPRNQLDYFTDRGTEYVLLTNVSGTLAVFGPGGFLSVEDWPEELTE